MPVQLVQLSPSSGSSILIAAVLTAFSGVALSAQSTSSLSYVLIRVVDPEGHPIGGAAISVVGTFYGAESASDGTARMTLDRGEWAMRVRRLGYRPDSTRITIPRQSTDALVIVLTPAPFLLSGIAVEAEPVEPFAQGITESTVRQVPPLLEADIFRAASLLGGVSQPNDLKGRIHLAGGASDETAITLDGHPLQDPFHLLGLLGAFNVAALQQANVHIHDLPAWATGRLSGLIELRSRASSRDTSEVTASLLAAGATHARPELALGVDLLASARLTYLDKFQEARYSDREISERDIRLFGFRDALLRLGRTWPSGLRVELLGFYTRDVIESSAIQDIDGVIPLNWGERLAGVRLVENVGRWSWNARGSFNRADLAQDNRAAGEHSFAFSTRDLFTAGADVVRSSVHSQLAVGIEWQRRATDQRWENAFQAEDTFSPNSPDSFDRADRQTRLSIYGEQSLQLSPALRAAARLRLWAVAGTTYPAPALRAEWSPWTRVHIAAAVSRRLQFEGELEEPEAGNIAPPVFLLEQPRVADVMAFLVGVAPTTVFDRSQASGELQLFAKRYRDRLLLSDVGGIEDGPGSGAEFPKFDRVPGRSTGLTLSARLLSPDGLSAQASYTYQRVLERAGGEWSPPNWDVPHSLSLFASLPFGRGWSANAVFQARSGVPETPVAARVFEPGFDDTAPARYLPGKRNSFRLLPYRRLDVAVRRQWEMRGAAWALSLQLLNALARQNQQSIEWDAYFICRSSDPGLGGPDCGDSELDSLPILPSIALEVSW